MAHSKTFYLNSGKKFSNLKSFVKELASMPKEIYDHHVNQHKNDFATWIKHSLKEEELAVKIDKEIDRIQIELEVLRHLVHTPSKKSTKKKATKKITEPKNVEVKIKTKSKTTPKKKTNSKPKK